MASGSGCRLPEAVNLSDWRGPDVRLPYRYCPAAPRPRMLGRTAYFATAAGDAPPSTSRMAGVLPTLLVPCCAHSGTTFLWRCMLYAFHPEKVCGSLGKSPVDPNYATRTSNWTVDACAGRRYLLPGLAGNIQGHWDYRKEWFFYGGGANNWGKGWHEYTGVALPLCYWEGAFQRALRRVPIDHTLAHSRRLCFARENSSWHAKGGGAMSARRSDGALCVHRSCVPLDMDKVRLSPQYQEDYTRPAKPRWQMQATKALPRLDPAVHAGAVVSDMTPNYLCSPKALRNLAESIGALEPMRLLALVRPPLAHVAAAYRMFVHWGWVRSTNLTVDVARQLDALRACNASLFADPASLAALPDVEVLGYFRSCWRGGQWQQIVTNAMPYVCARAWLASGFRPTQLLVLPSDTMRNLTAPQLLGALSEFTGLHYNRRVLNARRVELNAHCEAPPPEPPHTPPARRGARGGRRAARAPLVNTHSAYAEHGAQQRSRLDGATRREFERVAGAHWRLLGDLARSLYTPAGLNLWPESGRRR